MIGEMIRYNMMGYILQKFPSYLSTPRGRDFNGMDCTDMVRYLAHFFLFLSNMVIFGKHKFKLWKTF